MRDTGGGHTASTEAICNAFQIDSVTSIGVVKEALDSSGGHGRGTVATGRVEQGIIKFGDEVEALGLMHGPMVDSILQTFDAFHLQCCYANVS
ncbi:Elongation factor Tu [Arachis hypogaea]|nr:Elongation factor Tu [Arachis hypogaea]